MPKPYQAGTGFYPTLVISAIILMACLAMLLFLQRGLPVEPDIHARMSYMHSHRMVWLGSWLLWMASAFCLLLFCFYLLPYLPRIAATYFAVAVVAIGIVPDLTAEFIYAVVLPWQAGIALNADEMTSRIVTEQFRALEYLAVLLTGGFGNGAYNAGGLTLNVLGFRNPAFPRWLLWFGVPSWTLGLGLSAATIIHAPFWMRILTATSMALSIAWMLLVALIIFRRPDQHRLPAKDGGT